MTELLTVLAIIAVLAAILFPVFRTAKASAQKSVCIGNFRQVTLATQIYLTDYNDVFPPVNYDINRLNNAEHDRTWVQLLMPYTNGLAVFRCPSDYGKRPQNDASFDIDLVVGDPYKRLYQASQRSNVGYNYLYFSPVYRLGNQWITAPKSLSDINNTGETLLYVDSVYGRTPTGIPYGGGSYIVVPPCRYVRTTSGIEDSFGIANAQAYAPNSGWVVSNPNSQFRYGLAWPWHIERINVIRVGGNVSSIVTGKLVDGCDVRDNWSGLVYDISKYGWDRS